MGLIKDKILQEENRKLLANPKVQAMLRTIRYAEGATYNTRVGGSTFNDLSKKPGKKTYISSIGDYSSAEGAYQFLNKTWNGVSSKLGLTDFSPQSQDIAAVELIKQRGALDDVLNDNFEQAVIKLSGEWASLPKSNGKSTYKNQRARSIQDLKNVFYNPKYNNQPTQQQAPQKQEAYPQQGSYPYQEEDVAMTNDLINFDFSMVNSTFVGEGVPDVYQEPKEEVKKAQEVLTQQQNEKNFLGDLSQQPPQEIQQAEVPQQQAQLPQIDLLDTFSQVSQFIDQPIAKEGGRIPVSSQGVYEYPKQEVIVPTEDGKITMRGVDYPIKGTDEFGNSQMMYPNKDYQFKGKTIHEIPKLVGREKDFLSDFIKAQQGGEFNLFQQGGKPIIDFSKTPFIPNQKGQQQKELQSPKLVEEKTSTPIAVQ
jgi:muramidase (phage lysozyme)